VFFGHNFFWKDLDTAGSVSVLPFVFISFGNHQPTDRPAIQDKVKSAIPFPNSSFLKE
jgi:hypothetical protein